MGPFGSFTPVIYYAITITITIAFAILSCGVNRNRNREMGAIPIIEPNGNGDHSDNREINLKCE